MNNDSVLRKGLINSMVEGANSKRNEISNTFEPQVIGTVPTKNAAKDQQKMFDEIDEGIAAMAENLLRSSAKRNEVTNSVLQKNQLSESQIIINSMVEGMNRQRE